MALLVRTSRFIDATAQKPGISKNAGLLRGCFDLVSIKLTTKETNETKVIQVTAYLPNPIVTCPWNFGSLSG